MATSAPTLRSLARSLGLSHATVSAALNGGGRIKPETVQCILAAAKEAGYQKNPLTSAVMSEVRRSRNSTFRGTIAALAIAESGRPVHAAKYHADIVRGATERAAALGFKVEPFVVGLNGIPFHRLDTIFKARGIRGVVLLPSWNTPDVSGLDWTYYAGVYTDYLIERPVLASVYPDHYRAMMTALQRLRERGYRRPGLFVMPRQDERIHHRWEAAFLAFAANADGAARGVPCLKSSGPDRGEFLQWFREYEPDVVLGHDTEAIRWMEQAGAAVPATHGFVCLNLLRKTTACAGFDLQPALVGALALEHVVTHLRRHESSLAPEMPPAISVPPQWIDGPTLRTMDRVLRGVVLQPCPDVAPSTYWSKAG
jgi:DNA-binding LacI/PurR family transcriptional regulator